jgi:hypothetical protein
MPEIDTLIQSVPDERTLRELLSQTLERAEVLRALIRVAERKSRAPRSRKREGVRRAEA